MWKLLAHEQEGGEKEEVVLVTGKRTEAKIQPPDMYRKQNQPSAIIPKPIISGDQGASSSKLEDGGKLSPNTTGQPKLTENLPSQPHH